MKRIAFAAVILAALAPATMAGERYTITRPQVTLHSGPDDDTRSLIAGTVVASSPESTTLQGGAIVPATGASVGDLATFACESIDPGPPARSSGCELLRADPPRTAPRKGEGVSLWD